MAALTYEQILADIRTGDRIVIRVSRDCVGATRGDHEYTVTNHDEHSFGIKEPYRDAWWFHRSNGHAYTGPAAFLRRLASPSADIHEAIEERDPKALGRALASPYARLALEVCDGRGRTPLVSAVYRADLEAVELLLRAGAESQARDEDGRTLLARFGCLDSDAVAGRRERARALLLAAGASDACLDTWHYEITLTLGEGGDATRAPGRVARQAVEFLHFIRAEALPLRERAPDTPGLLIGSATLWLTREEAERARPRVEDLAGRGRIIAAAFAEVAAQV